MWMRNFISATSLRAAAAAALQTIAAQCQAAERSGNGARNTAPYVLLFLLLLLTGGYESADFCDLVLQNGGL